MAHLHSGTARSLRLAAVATSVALVVTACGSGNDGGAEASAAASTDTVRIDLPTTATANDPIANGYLVDAQISTLVHGRLFDFARGSATETVPVLAEGITVSEDGLTQTVELKPDLSFSDGSALTSADVVASVQRLRDPQNPNSPEAANITGVSAPDDSTVDFTLARRDADLSQTLALPFFAVVPAAAAEDPDYFSGDPVYSGPYVPEGDTTSTSFALVRNDEYDGPRPVVQRLEFEVITDPVTSTTRLQGGETDFFAGLPREQAAALSGNAAAETVPGLATLWIIPNQRPGAFFEDVRLRQALAWAIDRESLTSLAYGEEGEPQSGPFPVVSDYPAPEEVYPEQDLDRARELLRGTACEEGCSFSLGYMTSGEAVEGRVAVALQQMLEPLGMSVAPRPIEPQTFIQDSIDGNFELNIAESGGYNVPSTMAGAFDTGPTSCIFSGCVNDAAAPTLQGLLAATTDEEREAAAAAVERLYADWTPIIPVSGSVWRAGLRSGLTDTIGQQPSALFWVASE